MTVGEDMIRLRREERMATPAVDMDIDEARPDSEAGRIERASGGVDDVPTDCNDAITLAEDVLAHRTGRQCKDTVLDKQSVGHRASVTHRALLRRTARPSSSR